MSGSTPAPQVDPALVATVAAAVQAVLAGGQFATPAAVAQAVPVQPAAPVSLVKAVSPEDALLTKVGLKRASGGHTILSGEGLVAAARVFKTGTPEVVVTEAETDEAFVKLAKRGVVGVLITRAGSGVATQYLYRPESK